MNADVIGGVIVLALFAGLVVFVRVYFRVEPPEPLTVAATPSDAVEAATARMAGRGFAVSYQGQTSATFARPKRPSHEIGILLLLLGIVPGLLYYGLFRGTQTTTVVATSGPAGTNLVLSGDDPGGRRELEDWAREIPSGPLARVEDVGDARALEPQRRYCANCGTGFDEGAKFCASCGAAKPA